MKTLRHRAVLSIVICTGFGMAFGQPRVQAVLVPLSARLMDEVTSDVLSALFGANDLSSLAVIEVQAGPYPGVL